ncbi:MAG: TerB family tellurite resistance protein [Telmatospirillum sp.]|nr:TerB family tellurite resistance protein [Telmatospirillum sp.]
MLETFKSLFFGETETPRLRPDDDVRLAATVLMVEAASVDGTVDPAEENRIALLLRDRFGLSERDARAMQEKARALQEKTSQIYPFTRHVAEHFDADRRIEMIEMLWEVVLADGHLHDYEASLIRRVAGLLYVSDQDSGTARRRALSRLGLTGPVA